MAVARRMFNELLRTLAILLCPALLGAALTLAAPDPRKPDFAPPTWWITDGSNLHYTPPNSEFMLSREAAAQAAANREAQPAGQEPTIRRDAPIQ